MLPVIDELPRRSVRFVQRCLSSDSHTIRFVVNFGVYVGRIFLPIGPNVAFNSSRFDS